MTITPDKTDRFNIGIHTINHPDDLIVVDELARNLFPFS